MLKMRTEDQIRAYVDGYNDCFQQFSECLKGRKSVMDAVRKMMVFREAVNNVVKDNRDGGDSKDENQFK